MGGQGWDGVGDTRNWERNRWTDRRMGRWGEGQRDREVDGEKRGSGAGRGGAGHLPAPLPHLHVAVEFPERFVSQDLVDGWLGHRLQPCSTEGEQSITPCWGTYGRGGAGGGPPASLP